MEFTSRDIAVLISMTLSVLLITITMSGMGMVNNTANVSDIDKYQLDQTSFDLAGKFPNNPGTPSSGYLYWEESKAGDSDNQILLSGDFSNGYEVFIDDTGAPNGSIIVNLNRWESSNLTVNEEWTLNNTGEYTSYEDSNYKLVFEYEEIRNENTSNTEKVVYFDVDKQEGDTTEFIKRIPIVGGVFGAGQELASIVGWIGSIIYWGFAVFFELVISVVAVVINAVGFVIGLFAWLTSNYFAVVNASTGFAQAFVLIPGILLSIEYLKLGFILTDLIWLG